ncbi:unnamed protein product [Orchesella dallaii]|uniref:Poly(3-hydroxyalkanoate) depolymerase C n=1 Tax=Orchesella dallaii TaxID=48710 RepID=A0ABP1PYE8_9HEXA
MASKSLLRIVICINAVVMFAASQNPNQDTLGPMNVIRDKITMSGYSSGGAMAQMLQISYSSLFSGIAVFSHSFYRCGPANGDIDDYDRFCTTLFNFTASQMWDPAMVHLDIQEYFNKSLIEDPKNLKGKRLYVYTGLRNVLFTPRTSLNILGVYEPYIGSLETVLTRVQDATQLLPSNTYGAPCTQNTEETHFIGNCGFSGVTEAINFLLFDNYDRQEAFNKNLNVNVVRGNVSEFNQTEFTKDLVDHNMDEIGYYYLPQQCKQSNTPCFLHFYFHGCFVGREFNGPAHIENSGLLEMAERKGIIMIFPQAKSSPKNKIGCWDTFGVAGKYYATQQGPQVSAMKRMLDKILNLQPTPSIQLTPPAAPTKDINAPASSRIITSVAQPPPSMTNSTTVTAINSTISQASPASNSSRLSVAQVPTSITIPANTTANPQLILIVSNSTTSQIPSSPNTSAKQIILTFLRRPSFDIPPSVNSTTSQPPAAVSTSGKLTSQRNLRQLSNKYLPPAIESSGPSVKNARLTRYY